MKKIISSVCVLFLLFGFMPSVALAEANTEDTVITLNPSVSLGINAKAYILVDGNTGTVLAAQCEHEKLYPASVTKIMTLLLVTDAIDAGKLSYDQVITCSDTAAEKGGSQIWLEPGEQMTVNDLLKASFVYSANDACTLLGEQVAGSEEAFCELMNEKAAQLGMNDTHFDNCTGLDDDTQTHLTTAYDIALMARELLKKDYVKNYSAIWMDTLRNGATQLVNTNKLIRYYKGATGLKTGTTSKAGCCVCASAERDGLELIAVILGAPSSSDRFSGARALLDHGFANYEICCPETDASLLTPVKVLHGTSKTVIPVPRSVSEILTDKGKASSITQKVTLVEEVEAPVKKGDVLGTLIFYTGDTEVARTELIAAEDTEKMTVAKAFWRIFLSVAAKNKE